MDMDEIFKILDKSLLTKTYNGLNAEMYKAADEKAREILNELSDMLKESNKAV